MPLRNRGTSRRAASRIVVGVLLTAASSGGAVQPKETTRDLRFHHFHVAVSDPGDAMGTAAERLVGERAILQGHGPGIRVRGEYVVFERAGGEATRDIESRRNTNAAAADVYERAVRWTSEAGLSVSPSAFPSLAVSKGVQSGRVTAVAFSSSSPARTIAHLRARGMRPFEETADTARFRLSPGVVLEVIGETDLPDTHWCPMHPDARAAGPARCDVCGMDLVRIPPPKIGEYVFDVAIAPAEGGRWRFTFSIEEPTTGEAVRDFIEVHERLLHLFIVSRDLLQFEHVHPERRRDGSFELNHVLPAGEYVFIADFLPAGGTPQMTHRAVVTPGYSKPLFAPPPELRATPRESESGGLAVRLEAPALVPSKPSALHFIVSDTASGRPVDDLEPYLGASGHLLVVSNDLTTVVHGHPEGPETNGPVVRFDPIFPSAGFYKLWVQFQRKGRVLTFPFVIEVPPA